MPVKSIDYSKTVFYKLVCRDITITDIYVGSTTDFKSRKFNHKSNCSNEKATSYNFRVYQFIRENGGFENWDMILIHRQSCIDAHEAHTIERGYIETLCAKLNCQTPGRTGLEWYEDNKDRIRDVQAVYKETIKDKTREYAIKYREAHREKSRLTSIEWRENNKDAIKEKAKLKYEKNKDSARKKCALYREANKDAIKISKKIAYEKKKLLKLQFLVDAI